MSGSLRGRRIISEAVNYRSLGQTRPWKYMLRPHLEDIDRHSSIALNLKIPRSPRVNGKFPHGLGRVWSIGFLAVSSIAIGSIPVWAQVMPAQTNPVISEDISQTPSSSTLDRPILQLGSQGADVSELQAALKLLGYYSGVVSGAFDRATAEAVLGFQEAAGLNPNGIVDAKTWTRLFPATLPEAVAQPCICASGASSAADTSASGDLPLLRLGMRGTAVLGVQQRLQATGFFQGKVDGVFGTDTQAAVEAAQQSYDLQPDGVVGPDTWEVLMR